MLTAAVPGLLKTLPSFVLGLISAIVPVLLFLFKRTHQFLYGVCEIVFCIVLGLVATFRIISDSDIVGWLAFLSAMYVGARGWQNAVEGSPVLGKLVSILLGKEEREKEYKSERTVDPQTNETTN